MKINNTFLTASFLLTFGAAQISQGNPRTSGTKPSPKPRPPVPAQQQMSPAEIESLRQKSAQTRASVREDRKRAAEAEREAKAELAATLRRISLSPQDWKELFRSLETSRKTILPLVEKLPLSAMEQGNTPKIKSWLGDMYKTIAAQMGEASGHKTLVLVLQDQSNLHLLAAEAKAIEISLVLLKSDLGNRKELLPEVDASLAAIRDTLQQTQILIRHMAGDSPESIQRRKVLASTCQQNL